MDISAVNEGKLKLSPSVYELLKGKLTFSREPLWCRLVICLITASFLLAVIWMLREWAIPAVAMNGLVSVQYNRRKKSSTR